MALNIDLIPSWSAMLSQEFKQEYFLKIIEFLEASKVHNKIIYPAENLIFNAFNLCPFEHVKVIIIGQDPYHGENQANGLAFSVPESISIPPSLKNIFKELNQDLNKPIPTHGNLEHWAKQGVLLLNATLTVEKNLPNSHAKIGWHQFTNQAIKIISTHKKDIIFLLWGKFAESKKQLIDVQKHHILITSHPSPLGAYKGFLGCKHFSKTNEILEQKMQQKINW